MFPFYTLAMGYKLENGQEQATTNTDNMLKLELDQIINSLLI